MWRSFGWMTPFASTRLVLSAVGISFSAGWPNCRPVVIPMPSSAIALLDDQDVVVCGAGARLGPEGGRRGTDGRVVVDDQDVLFRRLDDRRRLPQGGQLPGLLRRLRGGIAEL